MAATRVAEGYEGTSTAVFDLLLCVHIWRADYLSIGRCLSAGGSSGRRAGEEEDELGWPDMTLGSVSSNMAARPIRVTP